jgi:hypothetical protein
MDEAGRKAARRRAVISFVAAGVLVVVSVVGLIGVDRRHHRWDRPGLERIEDRIEDRAGRRGPPGAWDEDDGPRGGGQDSRPVMPGAPGRGPRQDDGTQSRPDGSERNGPNGTSPTSSTTTSTSTTTTAPSAGGI